MLSTEDALAYAMTRMPATFGATAKALQALVDAAGPLSPATLLDVGCGPGTATIAAVDIFPDLQNVVLMDRNGPFLTLANDLVGSVVADAQMSVINQDITRNETFPTADLVIASYVMVELDPALASVLAKKLWAASAQALVLVEPGTPEGFRRLQDIRTALISEGATVAAPCTHENTCPMTGENWCRFMARVQRSRDHRMLKQAALAYEDEPFAYLALVRNPASRRENHRIVASSTITKIGVSLPACGKAGLETLHASKRDVKKHKYFKRLEWGDTVENLIPETLAEG